MRKALRPQALTSSLRLLVHKRPLSDGTSDSELVLKSTWNQSYKEIMQQIELLNNQFKELNKQIEKLHKDTSVHDELIKQNSRQVEQVIKKEVSYVLKEQDYVTNSSLRQQLDDRFSVQEKLLDSKLVGMEARLINEYHKSKQDTIRWTAAIGAAGLTLGFGIFQYYENKRIEKNEEQILRSLPQIKQ